MNVLRVIAAVVVGIAATVAGLYLTNAAPRVREVSTAEIATASKPYVVKMHAQWCPKCRMQKGVWSDLAAAYGDRAHLVVLDFTDDETTAASRAEANRLGLGAFFDEYAGATGFVVVLDRNKQVSAEVGGRAFDAYRDAVDAALRKES